MDIAENVMAASDHSGSVTERSYPTAKVRVATGAPGCDGTGAAKCGYPMAEVMSSGREEQPHVQGMAVRAQEGREEPLHFQCQEGQLIQGKEQRLRFAGAAVKRYPTSRVREITA